MYNYGYENTYANNNAILGATIVYIVILLAIAIIGIISQWKIYKKAGYGGWECLIPIYNIIVLLKIAELPIWYIVLFIVPIANIYAIFKMYIELAHKFGKSTGFGVATVFFNIICFPILAFSKKCVYIGNNKNNQIQNNNQTNTENSTSNITNNENNNFTQPQIETPITFNPDFNTNLNSDTNNVNNFQNNTQNTEQQLISNFQFQQPISNVSLNNNSIETQSLNPNNIETSSQNNSLTGLNQQSPSESTEQLHNNSINQPIQSNLTNNLINPSQQSKTPYENVNNYTNSEPQQVNIQTMNNNLNNSMTSPTPSQSMTQPSQIMPSQQPNFNQPSSINQQQINVIPNLGPTITPQNNGTNQNM